MAATRDNDVINEFSGKNVITINRNNSPARPGTFKFYRTPLLILGACGLVAIGIISIGLALVQIFQGDRAYKTMESRIQLLAENLENNLDNGQLGIEAQRIIHQFNNMNQREFNTGKAELILVRSDMTPLVRIPQKTGRINIDNPRLLRAIRGAPTSVKQQHHANWTEFEIALSLRNHSGMVIGALYYWTNELYIPWRPGSLIAGLSAALLVFIAAAGLANILLVRRLKNRIAVLNARLEKFQTNIDFTQSLPAGSDELTATIRFFNSMLERLDSLMEDVQDTAGRLEGLSDSIDSETRQMTAKSEEIAKNLNEVSSRTSEQNMHMDFAAASTGKFKENLDSTAELSHEVFAMLTRSSEQAANFRDNLDTAVQHGREVYNNVSGILEGIQNHTAKLTQVEQIAVMITKLTKSTNLLSLNAAIEASRAGEAGRGFRVVAEEIKELSERSKQSAAEISTIIETMRTDTAQTASHVDGAKQAVTASVGGIQQQIKSNLEVFLQTLRQAHDKAGLSHENVEGLKQEMSRTFSEFDVTSKNMGDIANTIENIRLRVESQHAALVQVTSDIGKLMESMHFLSTLVGQVKT